MVAILYLISALLFIFALRGLSHPESSRMGNIFGIIGMIIAVFTTLMFKSVLSYYEIGAAILIGGAIGGIAGYLGGSSLGTKAFDAVQSPKSAAKSYKQFIKGLTGNK